MWCIPGSLIDRSGIKSAIFEGQFEPGVERRRRCGRRLLTSVFGGATLQLHEGRRNSLLPQVDKVTRREKQPRVLHWPRPQQRERIYTTTDEPRGAEQQSLHHEHSSVSPRCQGLRHVHILADRDRLVPAPSVE